MGNFKRKIENLRRYLNFYKIYRKGSKQKDYFDRESLICHLGIENDEYVFLSSTGIGDLYIKLILLNGLKESLNTKKISIGYLKEKHIGVINLFNDDIYKVYKLEQEEVALLSEKSAKPELGSVSHPYSTITQFNSIGFRCFNFLDLIKLQFNIPLEFNRYCKPKISHEIESAVFQKMNNLGIKKNSSVLISPTAVTFKPINSSFWIELIELLTIKGKKVLLLDNPVNFNNYTHENLIYFDFPLEEAISICNYCGNFIGYRSGMCDLIESSTAKKTIIYPETSENYYDHFKGFSFIEMGFSDTSLFQEIVFKEHEKQLITEQILNHIYN